MGLTQAAIAITIGVSQSTVARWLDAGEEATASSPMRRRGSAGCPDSCEQRRSAPHRSYAYLLGQYLGDGTIARTRRGVYRLFVSCTTAYPGILEECRQAIQAVLPHNVVGQNPRTGCTDLTCYSKHWPCLFPQHGPGKKHTRPIALEPWQSAIALDEHPRPFLRGLLHSDGSRFTNTVRGANGTTYSYPRYCFSNRSDDIRRLFGEACTRLGIEWRQMNRYTLSVARRDSVALLDTFVGPKT